MSAPNTFSVGSTTAEATHPEPLWWYPEGFMVYVSELCHCGSESSHPEQSVTNSQQLRNARSFQCPGPREDQRLADWFGSRTLSRIKAIITAAQSASGEASAKVLDEVREPECINVLATKMVQADYHDYFDFCANLFSDVPPEVKRAGAAVIVANRQLKDQFLENLLGGEFPVRVFNWIFQISEYYPAHFFLELDAAFASALQQRKNARLLDFIGIVGLSDLLYGFENIPLMIRSLAVIVHHIVRNENGWKTMMQKRNWLQGRKCYFENSWVYLSHTNEKRQRLDRRGEWNCSYMLSRTSLNDHLRSGAKGLK